jgi:hypothetical protein
VWQEIPKSSNAQEVENCVIHDMDESEGENNLVVDSSLVGELAAIPDASLAKAASRWSKRRASDTSKDSIKVILRHFHRCCYRSNPLWFFCWRGLWSLGR